MVLIDGVRSASPSVVTGAHSKLECLFRGLGYAAWTLGHLNRNAGGAGNGPKRLICTRFVPLALWTNQWRDASGLQVEALEWHILLH